MVAAIAAPAGAQSGNTAATQHPAGWWIAERDPAGHTRITFDAVYPDPNSDLSLLEGSITAAQFASLEVTRPLDERRAPSNVRIGDAFDLRWSGQTVRVRITALFALHGGYDLKIGADVAADPAGEAKLAAGGCGYFLARQARTSPAPATESPAVPALFPTNLPGALQAQIGAMLTPRALQAAADTLAKSPDPKNPYEGWLHRFLASTPAAPRLDIQGVRLTGTVGERYFVRAEWSADGKATFVLGAWVKLDPAPSILSVDMTALDAVQSGFDCCSPSEPVMPMDEAFPRLLCAVDMGNGRTGVFRKYTAFEAAGIELDEYTDASGLTPTGLFVPFM